MKKKKKAENNFPAQSFQHVHNIVAEAKFDVPACQWMEEI